MKINEIYPQVILGTRQSRQLSLATHVTTGLALVKPLGGVTRRRRHLPRGLRTKYPGCPRARTKPLHTRGDRAMTATANERVRRAAEKRQAKVEKLAARRAAKAGQPEDPGASR